MKTETIDQGPPNRNEKAANEPNLRGRTHKVVQKPFRPLMPLLWTVTADQRPAANDPRYLK